MGEMLVAVQEEDVDDGELDRLAAMLRNELLGLDVDEVRRAASGQPAPPGTRGVDVAAVGALVVSLAPTAELLSRVLSTVRAWLQRGPSGRVVEIAIGDATLKITNASESDQSRLIDEFVHAAART
jgi:hypothetical protein